MLRRITATQLLEWMEFSNLEPFGEVRGDYQAASIVQMIANMNRDTKKHPKPFPIGDFVLKFGEGGGKRQSWQEQKLVLAQFAAMYAEGK